MSSDPWCCLAMEVRAERAEPLNALEELERLADGLAACLGVPLPERDGHRFTPIGLSLMRYGEGGRLVVHTWPEHSVATIDVWMRRSRLVERAAAMEGLLARELNGRVVASRLHEP